MDGNYRGVRDLVMGRATVVFALDLPRATIMRQITRRTLRRAVRHEELWNGNYERPLDLVRWDPHKSILRWSWTTYHPMRERLDWLERVAADRGALFVRVRSHEAARAHLAHLTGVAEDEFVG